MLDVFLQYLEYTDTERFIVRVSGIFLTQVFIHSAIDYCVFAEESTNSSSNIRNLYAEQ